jgi:precorrin-2 dehydrogenase / sirohydrochlorin ferrochelatase
MSAEPRDFAAGPATYPLVLTNLAHVRCVVVGGGRVAERKVRELLAGGARLLVISPLLTAALAAWHAAGQIEHMARCYQEGDLTGAFLVIAATDDSLVNQAVAAEGARRGILVNSAADPSAGNFHTPATVRRGDLLLTVSTGGGSPALAAHIQRELAARYGDEYARLLGLLRAVRAGPARAVRAEQRSYVWQRLISERVLDWLRDGEDEQAARYVEEQIKALRSEA